MHHRQTGLLVSATDTDDISAAIIEQLENPSRAVEMAQSAYNFVHDTFNSEVLCSKILQLYRDLK